MVNGKTLELATVDGIHFELIHSHPGGGFHLTFKRLEKHVAWCHNKIMKPYFDLALIKLLAEAGQVVALEKAQDMAINEYGYMLSNIIDCILDLKESDFYKSYDYGGVPHDAYKTKVLSLQTFVHKDLYVKFRVNKAKTVVVVSFHTHTID